GGGAALVRADEVALDEVRIAVLDLEALAVARDDVARAGGGAADRVSARAVEQLDAGAVGDRGRAARSRADEVPGDDVSARAGVLDPHARERVPRDDVPRSGDSPADRVAGRGVQDLHAVDLV